MRSMEKSMSIGLSIKFDWIEAFWLGRDVENDLINMYKKRADWVCTNQQAVSHIADINP